ncbi:MAG: recombinase family protein [Anaerolineae bacterium]|nr:recombinase family protein [Anaerolineae bacterium]
MTRCLIYCRTSGDDTDRDSLTYQEKDCTEHANKKGWDIFDVLKEDVKGVSGAELFAPEIQKAIDYARQGLYDILLVRDVKRFARDRFKANFVEYQLTEYNVKLEFVWQHFTDDSDGDFIKGIHYLLAQKERADIVKQMINGKRKRIEHKGSFIVSGNAPFGYMAKKDERGIFHAVIVEEEAKIIEMIFRWYVEDGLSVHAITQRLNDEKIPTYAQLRNRKRYRGIVTQWYPSNVANILRSETYCGLWRYGKKGAKKYYGENGKKIIKAFTHDESNCIEVEIPAIVSRKTWELAQVKLTQNKAGRRAKYDYLMAGRIKCHCGYSMSGSSHKNPSGNLYLSYRCPGHRKITKNYCEQSAVGANLVDELAWNWLENLLTSDTLDEKLQNYVEEREREIKQLTDKLYPLEHYLEELGKRYDKLIRSYLASDDFGQSKLLPYKNELEEEMKEYQVRRDKVKEELETCKVSIEFYKYYVERKKEGVFFDVVVSADNLPKNQQQAAREFDYNLADSLLEDGEKRERTFEEKKKIVKRFNLQAEILNDDQLRLTCDLGEEVLKLYNNKGVQICQASRLFHHSLYL